MKSKALELTVAVLLVGFVGREAIAQNRSHGPADVGAIFPKGQRAPASNFTGTVWVQQLIEPDSAFNIPVGYVTFEPGARSHWHSHAGGQVLLAMGGIGYYQERGKPLQILRKGDAVKCPPNVPHWHGASPTVGFMQVAITPNTATGRVTWLQPVTDEEYNRLKK